MLFAEPTAPQQITLTPGSAPNERVINASWDLNLNQSVTEVILDWGVGKATVHVSCKASQPET